MEEGGYRLQVKRYRLKTRLRKRVKKKLWFETQLHLSQNQIDHQVVGEVMEILPQAFLKKKGTGTFPFLSSPHTLGSKRMNTQSF